MSAPSVLVRLRATIDLRDVRAAMRAADVRAGRCTFWCATATCQSYARGEAHGARLLCPRCTR